MFNVKNYEYDCTHKCRCRAHGNCITAALTKRAIADDKLAAFIAKTCCNYCDVVDDLGRSAVHLAASVNRYTILEWLLNQGALINTLDTSGSSALHRAIYYGCIDCAVLLLRYGASAEILDDDKRCALQNVCRLMDEPSSDPVTTNNELLVWGTNKNYNLGIGNEEGTNTPQFVDYFRKEHICIESVSLAAYHSLFLDRKAQLYAVGHGKGGRLGNGSENSLPAPKRVKVPIKNAGEHVICISTSRKHSLLLTNRSVVYACGLNENKQLGVRDAGEKLSVFKEVVTLRDYGVCNLVRVIARDYYSLAYAENCIYVWGTNIGQFGIDASVETVPLPKLLQLPPRTEIKFVEANNAAIAVVTTRNQILLYYNYKLRTIKAPNYETLRNISVVGGDATKNGKGTATALKLLIMSETCSVFLWYEMTQHFYNCIFTQLRLTQIDKILYKSNQVLILSQGDVYRGKCQQVPIQTQKRESTTTSSNASLSIWSRCDRNSTEISTEHLIRIELQRLAHIDRAVDIFCDEDFTAFAVLQESHMKYFKLPNLMPEEYTFKKLYNDANEYDAVHDLVFHVDSETFAAHKFIVFARAPGLQDTISAYEDKHIHLNYARLTGKIFELLLKHVYTNYLPNEYDLNDVQQSLGPDSPSETFDICQLFQKFAEQFKLTNLNNYLKSCLQNREHFHLPQLPDKTKYRFNRLRQKDLPELYDVHIVCAGDVVLQAHKCILVARLEYFDMMFTHTWAEQSTINLGTVPVEYMQPILDFLYSADVDQFRKQNFSETFLYNMIVFCDQFFIERLRKVCELLILEKISIRKCGDMLDFANMYNCAVLQHGCLDFICQNLARVLDFKSLEQCEAEALQCINAHYRSMFKHLFDYRIITPDADAVDDDLLLSFVDDFHVDLDYRMNEDEAALLKTHAKLRSKEHKPKQTTRQHERDAISSMLDAINLDENASKISQQEQSQKRVHDNMDTEVETKNWLKVVDKKEQKKKLTLEHILKCNEILKTEEKPKVEFVSLVKTNEKADRNAKTPEKETTATTIANNETTPTLTPKVYNLNLADITPPIRERLSQKQRKRLSSESNTTWRATNETKPIAVPTPVQPPQNAWGVLPQTPSSLTEPTTPTATGSANDVSSFANMMRAGLNTVSPGASSTAAPNNSFSKILAEERKQRDYYERMRSKSLILTQIEETAIAELREFYNVDNVTDEIITIERKAMPRTMNFAVWQRN